MSQDLLLKTGRLLIRPLVVCTVTFTPKPASLSTVSVTLVTS